MDDVEAVLPSRSRAEAEPARDPAAEAERAAVLWAAENADVLGSAVGLRLCCGSPSATLLLLLPRCEEAPG